MAMIQREYKDRLFQFIFGSEENKEWTLSLYNAVNGTDYSDPEKVQINTIKEVLYLGMHNDRCGRHSAYRYAQRVYHQTIP